ncbi:hypothetical protein Q5424_20860 [Conexibacter sp. JD483]|uniref:hypothetical protein n=1 Tax=unclassified Conexibacter TaxID=2627773 RepID=UPI002725E3C8|nr:MULTISPECIES: hypothetical protein [unclassified Conexibacter]MDO8185023.1 hypothetical protein [Conexibacter sp. CPCC 205706]MDO8198167.1 hypothetical protein [Conexibacter sp. CPCC 205762]MDR9371563.1 hypothetical protein [Conexibacter sp. JD483]
MSRISRLAMAALALAAVATPARALANEAQPVLGFADRQTTIMGAASEGAPGETWAFRLLPLGTPPLLDGSGLLGFGQVTNAAAPAPQLVFGRATDDSGVWSPVQTPVDENGAPYRGPQPNVATARVTARGGGVLVGRDSSRDSGRQAVVLVRDGVADSAAGGRFRPLPALPDGLAQPDETIARDEGSGTVPIAAYDELGGAAPRTGVFLPLVGAAVESGIAHWDGSAWTREPIELPTTPAPVSFRVVALAASGADDAWMLARTEADRGDGILLFARVDDARGVRWVPQDLGTAAARFSVATTTAEGIEQVAPLDGEAQQPLTAAVDGVWIDGSMRLSGGLQRDFTLRYGKSARRVIGSWCDATGTDGAALCDTPLEFRFGRRAGYRSFAFAGDGYGRRVITNPLTPDGDDTTNAGSWESFDGRAFARNAGAGGNYAASGGFATPDRGWIEGPVQVTDAPRPARLADWPVSLRSPLLAIATQPGGARGSLASGALAVGAGGAVARYAQATGWQREYLLTSTGAVNAATLRGIAWPEAGRAYAVGDLGAMWLWRSETGLWERDAAAPIAFDGNLMGVAFDPADPQRGYAVGRDGVLLAYGKTWTQETLPAGFERADLTAVAFAGRQALVVADGDLLLNDGDGRGWRVDTSLHALLAQAAARARLVTVGALPDGGAVVAGAGVVFARDTAGGGWRPAAAPLPSSSVVAVAPLRVGNSVRAIVSVVPDNEWPPPTILPPPDPDVPDPLLPPFQLAGDGYVLRETDSGWRDEQRAAYAGVSNDKPEKADPIAAFALDPASGDGWAVGGWSGYSDNAGRGTSASGIGATVRDRTQTVAIERYSRDGTPAAAPSSGDAAVALDPTGVTFAVAGHATCDGPCALLAGGGLGPDRAVSALLDALRPMAGQAGSPRALLYTGGRLPTTSTTQTPAADSTRLAGMLSQASLPVFGTVSAADSLGDTVGGFRAAYAALPAPFGTAAKPAGVLPVGSSDSSLGTRTHYAFDSSGGNGLVRVIVIDNSRGSLAASDPYQVPLEAQEQWLWTTLRDARSQGIPAIVVGSRDLNTRFVPSSNVAADGDAIAKLLVDEGASAYLYERPEEQRVSQIPAGGTTTIPAYGTGTLGYRSPIANAVGQDQADALFGDSGYLLMTVDVARRDQTTNRAPVTVRMEPLIKRLSLAAVDGTLLRRSRPALFQGLGRRPLGGDRWGPISASDGSPNPTGSDPYIAFPAALCQQANCGTRVTPDYRFTSSDPDIADFVAVDPNTSNLRKPLQTRDGKTVTDSRSGLLCAFNPGRATLTVSAGGMSYSQVVTVQTGSVQQPCGTRPLDPARFRRETAPSENTTPPPSLAPTPVVNASPSPAPPPPPPIVPAQIPPPVVRATPRAPRPRPAAIPFVPPPLIPGEVPLQPPTQRPIVGVSPPPPTTSFTSPTPPGGATIRVYEEKREEEVAPESSQAFARYDPDEHVPLAPALLGVAMLAAFAGTALTLGVRRRDRNGPRRVAPLTATARARARADQRQSPMRRRR